MSFCQKNLDILLEISQYASTGLIYRKNPNKKSFSVVCGVSDFIGEPRFRRHNIRTSVEICKKGTAFVPAKGRVYAAEFEY